jgi:hypothetical protein
MSHLTLARVARCRPNTSLQPSDHSLRSRPPAEPMVLGRNIHIGVVFALVWVVLASGDWLESPTLLPALIYGIGTIVFPQGESPERIRAALGQELERLILIKAQWDPHNAFRTNHNIKPA